jgi:hypothetical protein
MVRHWSQAADEANKLCELLKAAATAEEAACAEGGARSGATPLKFAIGRPADKVVDRVRSVRAHRIGHHPPSTST